MVHAPAYEVHAQRIQIHEHTHTHTHRMVHTAAYEVHAQRIQMDTPLPRSKVWPEVHLGLTQAAAGKSPRTRLSGAPQRAC
jgi:hypothetical protein